MAETSRRSSRTYVTPEAEGCVTVDLPGCARCHGDGHDGLLFSPLTHPVVDGEGTWTHWAPCPTNGEPILLQVNDDV